MPVQDEGGSGDRDQVVVVVRADEEGMRPEEHFHNFGRALQQAVNQAADSWGPGTHTANVQLAVVFRKVNPGEIGAYKVVVG